METEHVLITSST